ENPVKDASIDYTGYIQEAIFKYDNLVFPSFPLLINDKGLKIGSNKTLTFLKGSELRLKASSKKSYAILDLKGVSNIEIYNPVIIGDRYKHLGDEGEWGMGISIKGSKNVKIFGAKIKDCWGDGIYIGQVDDRITCQNIYIKDAYLSKNRRDGISIISVDGLILDNVYAGYSDGTKPMTGINFEPNNAYCELKNIKVLNPRTENNGERGIQVVNRTMLEENDKNTDIVIVNHSDIGSPKNAFKLACNPTDDVRGKMYGFVSIINPNWVRSSKNDIPMDVSTNQANFKITISSPKVTFMNGKVLPYNEIFDLFMKQSSRAPLKIVEIQP
ncbi:MAG: right-handed parallel beta-helix repeat-containing protein, partial [Flavobacterium sp.]|nr:right-handed parallel beta-helix repeat-containing protein [Pedobacter sp.]